MIDKVKFEEYIISELSNKQLTDWIEGIGFTPKINASPPAAMETAKLR